MDGGGTDWPRGREERGEDGTAGGEVEGGGEVPAAGAAWYEGCCCCSEGA